MISVGVKKRVTCVLCSRLEVAVVDNSDGSYSISYTPVEPGSYSVWDQPRVRGQHGPVFVFNYSYSHFCHSFLFTSFLSHVSHFVLNVKRKVQRHCGTFHCCSFCSSGGSKEARCGCTGTMPGRYSRLQSIWLGMFEMGNIIYTYLWISMARPHLVLV